MSTSLELAPMPAQSPTVTALELVDPAMKLVEQVADTTFVPREYRGKPGELLAAILTGHELGLPPMAAISKIHNIQGRASLAAEAMRAVVLAHGHDLWVVEASNDKVKVSGRRRGADEVSTFTWTMDDARKANLAGKQVWRQFPKAMLLARATGELCRAIFADCLAGISYTLEEVEDGIPEDGAMPLLEADLAAPAVPAAGGPAKRARRAAKKAAPVVTGTPAPERPAPAEDPLAELDELDGMAGGDAAVADPAPAEEHDDGIEDALELIADNDLRAVHAASAQVWPDGDDATKKAGVLRLVELVDGGTVESRSDIPAHVVAKLRWLLEQCADEAGLIDDVLAGKVKLQVKATGALELRGRRTKREEPAEPDERPFTEDEGYEDVDTAQRGGVDRPADTAGWLALAKKHGLRGTQVIREAQRLAPDDGPASVPELVEMPDALAADVLAWIEAQ